MSINTSKRNILLENCGIHNNVCFFGVFVFFLAAYKFEATFSNHKTTTKLRKRDEKKNQIQSEIEYVEANCVQLIICLRFNSV